MIVKVFSTGPFETNTILIGCDETRFAAIVDTPLDSHDCLIQELERQELKPQMILLTHSHWDHLADAAKLKKSLGVPVYVHQEDKENLIHPGLDGLPLFFPIEGVHPDGFLSDQQVLSIGNLSLKVIHTPGHTPGGVCFWISKEKLLLSGDTLFKGTIGNLSFPTSRPALMWESLKKLAQLPPETRVLPGHGEETTIGAESWLADARHYFGG